MPSLIASNSTGGCGPHQPQEANMPHKPPFRFISDAAHGWLEVSRNDLAVIGLSEADFSEFSYKLGGMLYLEEDCDATTFIGTYEAIHGHTPRFTEHDHGNWSRIRGFQRVENPNFSFSLDFAPIQNEEV